MKRKINIPSTLFLLNSFIMWITGILEFNNLISCYESVNYQVSTCDYSLRLFIFIISLTIFCLSMIYFIIDVFILEWEDTKEKKEGKK